MKLYYALPETGAPDLVSFLDQLDAKLRVKLLSQFYLLTTRPLPGEPIIKHFTIEKYRKLYELRARSQIMVRIIFTIQDDGSVLFLTPFVKKHTRNTMHALDIYLKILKLVQTKTCRILEVPVSEIINPALRGHETAAL